MTAFKNAADTDLTTEEAEQKCLSEIEEHKQALLNNYIDSDLINKAKSEVKSENTPKKPIKTIAFAFFNPQISATTSVNKNVTGYVIIPVVRAWAVGLKGP